MVKQNILKNVPKVTESTTEDYDLQESLRKALDQLALPGQTVLSIIYDDGPPEPFIVPAEIASAVVMMLAEYDGGSGLIMMYKDCCFSAGSKQTKKIQLEHRKGEDFLGSFRLDETVRAIRVINS